MTQNTDSTILTGLAADCFAAARFLPSEAEIGKEYLAAASCAASVEGLRTIDKPPPAGVLHRKPRKPTLAGVAKQARKAGIEVERYEIKPDGTIAVITGKSESIEANPWLDDLKVTKQ